MTSPPTRGVVPSGPPYCNKQPQEENQEPVGGAHQMTTLGCFSIFGQHPKEGGVCRSAAMFNSVLWNLEWAEHEEKQSAETWDGP